ncbi:FAD-dependent oxidoreductase [Alphaproteobacteria bacterium]|nr:FAD-dependent oxidoreductase [Alphaproteobacteria bacterium]MDA9581516.1 FAD-dependent oxidoreductase [bacterium]MDA8666989.1 FAD-dependent oxidoreductase [Alphaproteobacteria bacterium]MDA9590915.1 FAD-dependent oxidoreductase [Alphaproteobacteria bacterium]MDB2405844.1 FAD-dependent oxidoreductase [Alphaproteobacteria bacterium]
MSIVVIGAGQAGLQTIMSLRQTDYEGDITLVGDEAFLPYQRPPLSKAYLSGNMERERLFLKPDEFFTENNVTLKLNTSVESLDAAAKSVTLSNGETLSFEYAVIATGSRPRLLNVPGRELANIFDLRGMADIDAMQPHFVEGKKLVVVGGGYIGLEAAAVAAGMGLSVHVLEAAPRLLARVAEPEISDFYTRIHQAHGVTLVTESQMTGFVGDGAVSGVEMADGSIIDADIVITGIGILPNVEIAETAGLAVENGIVVNEVGQTSDAHIFAAGDCTSHPNDLLGRTMRLESVPNAIEQGKAVASAICGTPKPYHQVPWFWSDQYDVKLQIAGVPTQIDSKVLRGDDSSNSFAWFYFTGDKLTGVTAINRPAEFMAGRMLIEKSLKGELSADPAKLADEDMKPKEWLA